MIDSSKNGVFFSFNQELLSCTNRRCTYEAFFLFFSQTKANDTNEPMKLSCEKSKFLFPSIFVFKYLFHLIEQESVNEFRNVFFLI